MYNPKSIPMKALKIILMIALFVSVSSQTDKKPTEDSMSTYETTKAHYDLLAHNRAKVDIPGEG